MSSRVARETSILLFHRVAIDSRPGMITMDCRKDRCNIDVFLADLASLFMTTRSLPGLTRWRELIENLAPKSVSTVLG